MRVLGFSSLRSGIIFVALFFLLFLLSLFSYFFNQLLTLLVCFFIISRLVRGVKLNTSSLRNILVVLIVLVTLWAGYWVSPRFNFWLTSPARQSLVDRMISDNATPTRLEQEVVLEKSPIENLLLGRATAYINQDYHSVYFNYYKRGASLLNQAAFFVYTSDPTTIDPRYIQLKQLRNNWFFLLRGYAD